jgi:hypothetical protein
MPPENVEGCLTGYVACPASSFGPPHTPFDRKPRVGWLAIYFRPTLSSGRLFNLYAVLTAHRLDVPRFIVSGSDPSITQGIQNKLLDQLAAQHISDYLLSVKSGD